MKLGREGIETRRDKNETGYVTPVSLGPYHNFASTTTTKKQLNQNMGKTAQAPRNKRQQRQILKKSRKKTLNRAQLKSVYK